MTRRSGFLFVPVLVGLLVLFSGVKIHCATDSVLLETLHVSVEIIDSFALTTTHLTFRNPYDRILEHAMTLSLLDGQSVVGFALDVDGKLRWGSAVGKAKGQKVFEEIVRRGVDPGLMERTEGNNYRVRVYPIPPLGTKEAEIVVLEKLSGDELSVGNVTIPLSFGEVGEFTLRAVVKDYFSSENEEAGTTQKTTMIRVLRSGMDAFDFPSYWKRTNTDLVVELTRSEVVTEEILTLGIPSSSSLNEADTTGVSYIENRDLQTYYYVPVRLPTISPTPRPVPSSIAILWDTSGSGKLRNHKKELSLLDAYFGSLRSEIDVFLANFHIEMEDPIHFVVSEDGNWSELRETLEESRYDGGTNLDAICQTPFEDPDAYFLFSDGLSNFGLDDGCSSPFAVDVPLFVVHSAVSGDTNRLKSIAWSKGKDGAFVDLSKMSEESVLHSLRFSQPRLFSVMPDKKDDFGRAIMADIFPKNPGFLPGDVDTLGILGKASPNDELPRLIFEIGTASERQYIEVDIKQALTRAKEQPKDRTLISSAWAVARLDELMSQDGVQEDIVRLGKDFGIITGETSLIVLETVQDYIRYDIAPPEELQEEYDRLMSCQGGGDQDDGSEDDDEDIEEPKLDSDFVIESGSITGATASVRVEEDVYDSASMRMRRMRSGSASGLRMHAMAAEAPEEFYAESYEPVAERVHERPIVLLDVTPLTLGIESAGGLMMDVIPRNSKIPTRKERNFTMCPDSSDSGLVLIRIFEGERKFVRDNHFLGEIEMELVSVEPETNILVTFTLDVNGVLHVTASDDRGTEGSFDVDNEALSHNAEEIDRMVFEAERFAQNDRIAEEISLRDTEEEMECLPSRPHRSDDVEEEDVRIDEEEAELQDDDVEEASEFDEESEELGEFEEEEEELEMDDGFDDDDVPEELLPEEEEFVSRDPNQDLLQKRSEVTRHLKDFDELEAKGDKKAALRALSNLAEIDFENHEILRILGHRLMQSEYASLSLPIFQKVLKIRPEECQSFRDLALAHVACGGHDQQAIDLLWEVVARGCDSRFKSLPEIVKVELNAIILTSSEELDLSAIDPSILREDVSADIRIVLTWDQDQTDMDLWVTDPNFELAKYDHPRTEIGGQLSDDLTQGYGPEVFTLRNAINGKYIVQVNYYGSSRQSVSDMATLQVTVQRHFGTDDLSEKSYTIRLDPRESSTVTAAEFFWEE